LQVAVTVNAVNVVSSKKDVKFVMLVRVDVFRGRFAGSTPLTRSVRRIVVKMFYLKKVGTRN